VTLRKKVQIVSALALNSSFFFELKSLCLPVLNCHSCPLAIFACPIGMIGQFSALHLFPFLTMGLLLLLGALIGRFFCGWCCPFGLLQELLYKIPSPKITIARHVEKLKYLVLAVLVIALPFFLGTRTPLFFCKLCPPATIQSALPWAIIRREWPELIPGLLRMALFLSVILLATLSLRAFCKILCPLGALMGMFNKFSLLFVIKNDTGCNHCKYCEQECPMGITYDNHIANGKRSSECILCAECGRQCAAARRLGV
jgi:ferredoxin-type protein NapH